MRNLVVFVFSILFINCSSSSRDLTLKVLSKLAKFTDESTEVKSREKRAADVALGKDYLLKYGYMSPGSLSGESKTAAQQSWVKALADMQSFLGLEPTGTFDDATVQAMKKPRCANSDKTSMQVNFKRRKRRYVAVGSKWGKTSITYSIENFTPKLGKTLTHEAIDAAFKTWEKHVPLNFIKIMSGANADIQILFAEGAHNDNTAFDGVGGYLAHAYYPGSGIGGDTHFDGAEPWTLHKDAYEGNDLFLVAVHELGHALGLGHSAVSTAIMAPIYKYHDTANFELPQDDIFGIQNIYGVRNSVPEKPIVPTSTKRTTTTPATTTEYDPYHTRRTRPPRTRRPTTTRTTTTLAPVPELCKLEKYDAISYVRNELYIFSGQYMWRRRRGETQMRGPIKISRFWPEVGDGVDAVYENPNTDRIVFFKGLMYWMYKGTKLVGNHPRHVRYLGLQNDNVGAAVWWERNGKTYFFKGSYYWRFSNGRVEKDYPKPIRVWEGVPSSVDSAFAGVGEDGKNFTYFVKGTQYLKFNNWDIKVVEGPLSFKKDWLKCDDVDTKSNTVDHSGSTSVLAIVVVVLVVVATVVAFLVYVVWRRRRTTGKQGTVTSVSSRNYTAGYSNKLAESGVFPEKTMCVSAAQQRIRRLQYTFQEKV